MRLDFESAHARGIKLIKLINQIGGRNQDAGKRFDLEILVSPQALLPAKPCCTSTVPGAGNDRSRCGCREFEVRTETVRKPARKQAKKRAVGRKGVAAECPHAS